jgi:hypothetical protein
MTLKIVKLSLYNGSCSLTAHQVRNEHGTINSMRAVALEGFSFVYI